MVEELNTSITLDDSVERLIGTRIETPIRFRVGDEIVEVGRFFANVERNLNGISVQIYFNEEFKDLVRENMSLLAGEYSNFYQSLVQEANLAGWDFIS